MSLQVGKYQLLDRIGSGGMAEIHLARITGAAGFEKLVVVKRLLPDLAEEDEFVRQFIDEARLAAGFSHANIVTTFDFGQADGSYYIAMEYVEGKNLRRIADSLEKRGKRLPEAAAVHIIAEAARGLDYAHQRKDASGRLLGIVHRDVSPQNIVVSYNGDVKVLDFGIAKSAAREYHTAAGIVKGKLRYMAPEQVTGEPIDGRADLFALAVVLWELLYGRRLMPDLPDTELVEWVRKGEFIRPPDVNPSWEIDSVLARALEVDPKKRFASCAELATALNRHNITQWPHWTPSELSRLLLEEFGDDSRREREWIAHILGQVSEPKVQVEVNIPSSMRVVEAPSRDDIPTTKTPTGERRAAPTVLRPMEPDSGNTLSGFHVKAQEPPPPSAASLLQGPVEIEAGGTTAPMSPPPPVDRRADTEVSIPLVKGTPIQPLGPGAAQPPASTPAPARRPPWLFLGLGGGALLAGVAAAFMVPGLFAGADPTPVPTITPIALPSPAATPATAATSPLATPTRVVVQPTPARTPPAATPRRTATPVVVATAAPTAAPRAGVAFLSVNVTAGWASVYVDGKLAGAETPLQKFQVTPGKHVVTVEKNGRKRSETVELRPGELRTLLLEPP